MAAQARARLSAYNPPPVNRSRIGIVSAALVLAAAVGARGQEAETPTPAPEGAPPGRYHLGPFFITPRLDLGPIGVDNNVFYTSTDRRTDVHGSGGPGLELLLPFRRDLTLTVDGGVGYVYFARTESQRRLTGQAGGRFEWGGARTRLQLHGGWRRSFRRPSPDVDRRLEEDVQDLGARLRRRLFGRTSLVVAVGTARHEVGSGQDFLGTDLGRTLSRDVRTADAVLEYALTNRTALTLQGQWQRDEHSLEPARDTERVVAATGLRTVSKVLFEGHLLLGANAIRPLDALRWRTRPYVDTDVTWHVTRRTRVGGGYVRDATLTAFAVVSGPISAVRETMFGRFEKDIVRDVDVWITARRTRVVSDSPVVLTLPSGDTVESVRNDVVRELTANLGYRWRGTFRVGVQAGHVERRSSIADLGVEGLVLGGTVSFGP